MTDKITEDEDFDPDEITDERPFGRYSDFYKAVPKKPDPFRPRNPLPVEVLEVTEADKEFTAYLNALTEKYGGKH